jgi:hypothetical protein
MPGDRRESKTWFWRVVAKRLGMRGTDLVDFEPAFK